MSAIQDAFHATYQRLAARLVSRPLGSIEIDEAGSLWSWQEMPGDPERHCLLQRYARGGEYLHRDLWRPWFRITAAGLHCLRCDRLTIGADQVQARQCGHCAPPAPPRALE